MKPKYLCVVLALVGIMLMSVVLPSCAKEPEVEVLPEVEWIVGSSEASMTHHTVVEFLKFAEGVSKRTGGKFNIRILLQPELGFARDAYLSALSEDEIQMSQQLMRVTAQDVPEFEVFILPFIRDGSLQTTKRVELALRDSNVRALEKFGAGILTWQSHGLQQLMSREPIDDFTDLKGMKVRVSSAFDEAAIKKLNGAPIYMPFAEVYTALQRGVMDGLVTGLSGMYTASLYEACPYVYLVDLPPATSYLLYNIEAFNALPNEYKRALMDEGWKLNDRAWETGLRIEAESAAALESVGVTILEVPPEQKEALKKIVKPVADEWANRRAENRAYYDTMMQALGG